MKKPLATMPRYVVKRPDSRLLWFRMAVPKAMRAKVGRAVVQSPLGTTDVREAKALAWDRRNQLMREWGLLGDAPASRAPRAPSNADLEDAAVLVGYDMAKEFEDVRRLTAASAGGERWQRHQRRTAINLEAHTNDPSLVRGLVDAAIDELGLDLAPDTERYNLLCEYVSAARGAQLDTSYRAAHGDIAGEPKDELIQRVRSRSIAKARTGEELLELFERWAAERLAKGEKRADTVNQDRKVIEQFASFVGEDRAVRSITPQDVYDYREALRSLPPKWMAHKDLKGLGMRDATTKARDLELPHLAFTTVNKHLSTISPLFKWLAGQPAWVGLKNPCDGLFHDKVKGKNPRPPFTTPVLNKILQSPLFTGFLSDGSEHSAGNQHADDWRKWAPLVAMFTGARIGEIAQLRVGDVRQEHDVWMIHIAHDDSAGQSTKSGHSRPAAVHSKLEAIGFLAFVERQRKRAGGDRLAQLFPDLKPNNRGQIGAEPSRWWRDYLAAIGVKQGRDGIGAHSFRHELSDRLRDEAHLMDNEVAVCLGHSAKSTTGGYGQIRQGTVVMLKDWIEAVRWDGVDFGRLGDGL